MKKIIKCTFVLFTLASIFFSCNPDDTNDTPQPPEDTRDKFVGSWLCNENSSQFGQINPFYVTITLNPSNSSQIYLANFYQLGSSQKVYGVVTNNYVDIPAQTVSGKSVRGSGTITSNNTKINWNYYVNDGADIDTCTAVFTK
ncbi:MAG: hypothetical protein WC868_09195 [Bacteroidales bacterium]